MKTVILGGGLAGLSAALNLPSTYEIEILEKESRIGGLLRTDQIQNHQFDHGPHLFFHTDPYFVETFSRALTQKGFLVKPAKTGQWSFQTLVEFPYAVHLKKLPEDIVSKCVLDFTERQVECAKAEALGKPFTVRNYEEYCRTYFGDGFTDHFMIPYACKIWTVHPRDLATDWMGPRIVLPELKEVIRGAISGRSLAQNYIRDFRYPKQGGTESFVKGVRSLLGQNVSIETQAEVTEIDLEKKKITLKSGKTLHYEAVLSSLPLPELPKLIRNLPSSVLQAIDRLDWFGVLLMNFAHTEIQPNPYQWIYFDQKDACFHRIHYPSKLAPGMAPEGSTSMQAELSFSKHRPLKASESSLSEQAWEELSRLGFAAGSKAPLFSQTRKVDYAYAIMNHEREKSVQHIREFLESKSFIPCGRFGDWDYIWTDKVLLSGKSAAQKAVRLGS